MILEGPLFFSEFSWIFTLFTPGGGEGVDQRSYTRKFPIHIFPKNVLNNWQHVMERTWKWGTKSVKCRDIKRENLIVQALMAAVNHFLGFIAHVWWTWNCCCHQHLLKGIYNQFLHSTSLPCRKFDTERVKLQRCFKLNIRSEVWF